VVKLTTPLAAAFLGQKRRNQVAVDLLVVVGVVVLALEPPAGH
jgi:hypothetical protein